MVTMRARMMRLFTVAGLLTLALSGVVPQEGTPVHVMGEGNGVHTNGAGPASHVKAGG
jgi:hypothetical protein